MKKLFLAAIFLLSLAAQAQSPKEYAVTLTKDNTLVMNDEFNPDSVAKTAQAAKELDSKLSSKEPIYLVLDSPGGSIFAGTELIENLNNLNRPVHTITLFSASMAFQTVQGVKGYRLMVPNGTMMSHKAKGSVSGEFPGQLDSRYAWILSVIYGLDRRVVNRTNGKHNFSSYEALIENEYWCTPEDCVKQGLSDGIARVKCDASLSGTHTKLIAKDLFMGMAIEITAKYADCPTITGPLDYSVSVNGRSLFTKETKDIPIVNLGLNLTSEQSKALTEFIDKSLVTLYSTTKKVEYYRK